MKHEEIINNTGNKVVLNSYGDLLMDSKLKPLILHKVELTIVKLTKGGMAYLVDEDNKYYSVPTKNVVLVC
jgi:hypothetical protein